MVGCPPAGNADLFHQLQAFLVHENLLQHGIDGRVTLLADRYRFVHPAVDRYTFHLDVFFLDRDIQNFLVLMNLLVQAHRLGDDPLLAHDRRLFDYGNDLLVDDFVGSASLGHK
jgi:hypothetical protein